MDKTLLTKLSEQERAQASQRYQIIQPFLAGNVYGNRYSHQRAGGLSDPGRSDGAFCPIQRSVVLATLSRKKPVMGAGSSDRLAHIARY